MSAAGAAGEPWREEWVRSLLRDPVTGAELVDVVLPDGRAGLAPQPQADPARPVAYPVVDGVPVLLAGDAVPLR
ncbi:hypothetical protein FHN55_05785 [Streptomyces sp. NP160]|uniref:hypothetical protein n=1 Tax=Streptomyces sp. NP160 TaxID=2586637 RepID=UPI00111A0C4E|nr:hypothetical protein [Streptomyces sp. NP160]TNM68727.1 hypothetical protein FHN55_05785 [Streptomyces sp. NP160]